MVVPGLPLWTGEQGLSAHECWWVFVPVLRSVPLVGLDNLAQLAVWAQLWEAILVTHVGAQPPEGVECLECRWNGNRVLFMVCISSGIGEKCNNCLYHRHVQYSF